MKKSPSIYRLIVAALGAAMILSACGGGATPAPTAAPAPTEAPPPTEAPAGATEVWIVTSYPEGSDGQTMTLALTEQFEAAHPEIKVRWEFAGYDLYDQRIRGYVEAGNPPDMFAGSIGALLQYAFEGLSVPLDEYFAQQNYEQDAVWKDSFYASLMEQNWVQDAPNGPGYYAVPVQMHTGGIFYNEKIFEDLGLQPAATQQELLAQCAQIEESGISCFGIDGGFTPYITIPWAYIASRIGGADAYYDTALHKEGTSWTDNPAWLEAAQMTQQVFNYTQPGFLGSQWPAAQVEFSQGRMAMMWVPTWLPGELLGVAPDDFRLGLFRWPAHAGGPGDQTVSQLNFNGFSMLQGARHPQEAMDFMKFLSSRAATEYQANELLIPSPTVGAQMPDSLAGVQDILANSSTRPEGMGVDNDAAEWRTNVLEPLLADLALGTTPEDFIQELQAQSDDYYANR